LGKGPFDCHCAGGYFGAGELRRCCSRVCILFYYVGSSGSIGPTRSEFVNFPAGDGAFRPSWQAGAAPLPIKGLSIKATEKYSLPLLLLLYFCIVGFAVWTLSGRISYLFFFAGMGGAAASCEFFGIRFPAAKQTIRHSIQIGAACTLLGGISIYGGINFQFSQIFFDISSGIITGAFIQFFVARILLPFLMGNAFCSRACWDGAVFEFFDPVKNRVEKPFKRNELVAFSYLAFLIILPLFFAALNLPLVGKLHNRSWAIGENLVILSIGLFASRVLGSRVYCRTLCPFITISGLISRFSIFKISTRESAPCTGCGACNKNCPMLIDVRSFAQRKLRVADSTCILCERCVDACPQKTLRLAPGAPWR
jgi:ferredoxin-type protein NapH